MKLEFIMCGSHTDAFLSQAAIYRMALDSLGGDYRAARLVLCVGGERWQELPLRWQKAFERIELRWAIGRHDDLDYSAQADLTYDVIDPSADLTVICDADTLLVNEFSESFFQELHQMPAIMGCIAHYPPPLHDYREGLSWTIPSTTDLWERIANHLSVPLPDFAYKYTLMENPESTPFYINLGFLAGRPADLILYRDYRKKMIAEVKMVLDNEFCEQIAVPFAIMKSGLPIRELPMRFNYPNDPVADRLYPEEMNNVHVIHYLRVDHFDRHKIFHDPQEFEKFMSLDLEGSNLLFQSAVKRITGGAFPFPA